MLGQNRAVQDLQVVPVSIDPLPALDPGAASDVGSSGSVPIIRRVRAEDARSPQ
jgi:hypothetical protein